MKCPKCNCDSLKITDSRPSDETTRRRRKCLNCGYTFSTFEISMNDYYGLKIIETLLDDALSFADSIKNKRKEVEKGDNKRSQKVSVSNR